MQISKKIPFDDPMVLNGVRALYVVSNLIIAGIYLYVQQQINKKNGALPSVPAPTPLFVPLPYTAPPLHTTTPLTHTQT